MQALLEVGEPELIGLAAAGDRDAQTELVVRCLLKDNDGFPAFEAVALAEPFARMAAAHGRLEDKLMLAAVLRIRAHHVAEIGDIERAQALFSYSLGLCSDFTGAKMCAGVEFLAASLIAASDHGDALADVLLSNLTESLSAADADKLRVSINTAESAIAELELAHDRAR